MSKLVRLKPYAARLGHVLQNYTITTPTPMAFKAKQGWYEVSDEIAARLAKVPQQARHPKGPRAFMVANDKEHARQLDQELREEMMEAQTGRDTTGTPEAPLKMERPGKRARSTAAPVEISDEDKEEAPSDESDDEEESAGEAGGEDLSLRVASKKTRKKR